MPSVWLILLLGSGAGMMERSNPTVEGCQGLLEWLVRELET